jgi:hypothetical protein
VAFVESAAGVADAGFAAAAAAAGAAAGVAEAPKRPPPAFGVAVASPGVAAAAPKRLGLEFVDSVPEAGFAAPNRLDAGFAASVVGAVAEVAGVVDAGLAPNNAPAADGAGVAVVVLLVAVEG